MRRWASQVRAASAAMLQWLAEDRRLASFRSGLLKAARNYAAFAIAAGILALAFVFDATAPVDNALHDWRSRLVSRQPSGQVAVVEIDSKSLREAGEWPWPRARFAQAIRNLRAAGAQLIGFDVDFSARAPGQNDLALAEAIEGDPGAVVLPTFLQRTGVANTPLRDLSVNAVIGSVNVVLDSDGRVRRYYRGFRQADGYHASMGAVLAGAAYGEDQPFLIDFAIRPDQIPHLSFNDVLSNNFDKSLVRGRNILVGSTALELGDEFSTPAGLELPGVYIHALAFESLIQGRAMTRLRGEIILFAALCVLAILWPRRMRGQRKIWPQIAVAIALITGSVAIQTIFPLSIDIGLPLLAQTMALVAAIRAEFLERERALIEERERHLRFIAFHDPETSLPNRRALLNKLEQDATPTGSAFTAVLVLGIHRFSVLRGAIGYVNANKLVAALAARLAARLPSGSASFSVSTSILGLVAHVNDRQEAAALCEALLSDLEAEIVVEQQEICVTGRVGAAISQGLTADRLLEQATIALDQAWRTHQRHVLFDQDTAPDALVQFALISDMKKGLARGEFHLVYQPKMNLRQRNIIGAEALVRWDHPSFGAISPDRFVRAAEETGAIHDLTLWALARAIADQAVLRRQGIDLPISVNLSARTLTHAEICQRAIAAIRESDADICFEITETAIIDAPDAAIASLEAMRHANIAISIDDYGSGLSSLAYLKQIAADELKIDRALVVDLTTNARDTLILKSTVDLAHGLGMSVVAEGVETEHTLALLTSTGCDSVQGFVVSKPLALAQLAQFVAASAPAPAAAKAV